MNEDQIFLLAAALKNALKDTHYHMDAEIAEECARATAEFFSSSGYMVVEGWKPIADGCPTDGRPILACGGIINNGAVRRASAYGEWWQSERARYGAKAPPTHWMPLPPQAQISDEERSDEVDPASNSASLTP